jgi:sterol desaturase/sphingolipid hydroxylase (fatty acid hydroxylase superfamily)
MVQMQDIAAWMETWMGGPVDWKQIILIGLSPIFLLAVAFEWLGMRKRAGQAANFRIQDVLTNLNLGASYQAFELVVHALLLMAVMHWVYDHRFFNVPLNAYTALPLFILVEFFYYWFHRTSHRVRWFWCAHVVHHSGQHMSLSTAMRQSMLYSLTGYWVFFLPLMLIGLSPEITMSLYAVDLAYQFFVHTEAVRRMPAWYEYVFVTPSHHRVHHGRNPQYIDKNFGGVLILFDRWFGTFEAEVEPVDYSIPHQINSNNILTLNFHEFAAMVRDMLRPGPLWLRLKHVWAPPEWTRPSPH